MAQSGLKLSIFLSRSLRVLGLPSCTITPHSKAYFFSFRPQMIQRDWRQSHPHGDIFTSPQHKKKLKTEECLFLSVKSIMASFLETTGRGWFLFLETQSRYFAIFPRVVSRDPPASASL